MLTPQYCGMNSTQSDKYSLRPRSLIRKGRKHQSSANIDLINNNYEIKLKNCDLQTQQSPSNIQQHQSKTNKKAPPLSKYRRKTANARERSRMREINYAFEALRRAVPHIFVLQCPSLNNNSCSNQQSSPSEKLTKITTLRLAMRYINALSSVLNNNNNLLNNHNELSQAQESRQFTIEDQDLEQTSSHSFMELTSDESTSSLSLCNDNLYDDQHASSLMSMSMSIDNSRQSLVSNIYDDQLSLLEQNNLTYLSSDVGTCLDFTDQSLSPTDFTEQHSLSPFDELFEPAF